MQQNTVVKLLIFILISVVTNTSYAHGSNLYKRTCFSCHDTGLVNAPKLGDKKAWAPLLEKGIDVLVQTVISGKSAMPPRGGSEYSDVQIKKAVQYMLSKVNAK